ncbi:uncharacterized protein LOC132197087 isoform X2 [Neocloeon triangulifer]|uniref:uncharacterized protein LOC132197087 isoform X2 n=1 Tax=Neocloeon triangulifer TaxID=2078957 RepID=UPI00286F3E74|nr:uncharacterized protein LOC132197087 isoform X2 [Neocloeon triangulifer]
MKSCWPGEMWPSAVLDVLFSCLVVGPAVVGYWRGTWALAEHYIVPQDPTLSAWISLCIGCVSHLVFNFVQGPLQRHVAKWNCVAWLLVSRLYTAFFSFACVNCWRGVWQTLEHYTGSDLSALMVTTTAAIIALAVMRTLRNIAAPPFAIVIDARPGYFQFPTMFRVSPGSKDPALHTLDCVFSVFVIGSLVVIVWRGTWGILDIILMPEDPNTSAWLSLAIGYGVTVVGFALQVPARIACDKLSGGPRLIVADLYQFLCFCGTVNLWRGIWNLLDIYLLPETPLVSFWVTHWVCLIVLMILNCGNSLLVRGVYIDGEEEGGQCVVFQVNYLRYHYKEKRKRQAAAQVQGHSGHSGTEKRKDMDVRGPPGAGPGLENHHVHVPLMTHTLRDTIL